LRRKYDKSGAAALKNILIKKYEEKKFLHSE
jgi:hypothetical protein